jgi:hypothetical protein
VGVRFSFPSISFSSLPIFPCRQLVSFYVPCTPLFPSRSSPYLCPLSFSISPFFISSYPILSSPYLYHFSFTIPFPHPFSSPFSLPMQAVSGDVNHGEIFQYTDARRRVYFKSILTDEFNTFLNQVSCLKLTFGETITPDHLKWIRLCHQCYANASYFMYSNSINPIAIFCITFRR